MYYFLQKTEERAHFTSKMEHNKYNKLRMEIKYKVVQLEQMEVTNTAGTYFLAKLVKQYRG